jgi:hypothetical protein
MNLPLNDLISLASGSLIVVFSFLVITLYWKLANHVVFGRHLKDPAAWFAHGICVAFTAAALNAFFWKGAYRVCKLMKLDEWAALFSQYGGYLDLVISLMTVWAGFCHLYSAFLNLSDEGRREWHWFSVPWYPEGNRFTRTLHRMLRLATKSGKVN